VCISGKHLVKKKKKGEGEEIVKLVLHRISLVCMRINKHQVHWTDSLFTSFSFKSNHYEIKMDLSRVWGGFCSIDFKWVIHAHHVPS